MASPKRPQTEDASPKEEEASVMPSSFKGALQQFEYEAKKLTSDALRRSKRVLSKEPSEATSTTSEPQATLSPSKKRRRQASGYAPPSKYAHLSPLTDILEPNLICVFVGTNPGVRTATAGHAYAHPSNHFWRLLHSSGLTDRRLQPEEDVDLPRLYAMGNTNIVSRPSKDAAELSKQEMAAGTADLDTKFLKYKPEAVCIVGKGIWEAIFRYRYGRNPKASEFHYGWQVEQENMGKGEKGEKDGQGNEWKGARVFVTTSTSGLAASLKPAEKEAIWRPFGEWVIQRRNERAQQNKASAETAVGEQTAMLAM